MGVGVSVDLGVGAGAGVRVRVRACVSVCVCVCVCVCASACARALYEILLAHRNRQISMVANPFLHTQHLKTCYLWRPSGYTYLITIICGMHIRNYTHSTDTMMAIKYTHSYTYTQTHNPRLDLEVSSI